MYMERHYCVIFFKMKSAKTSISTVVGQQPIFDVRRSTLISLYAIRFIQSVDCEKVREFFLSKNLDASGVSLSS